MFVCLAKQAQNDFNTIQWMSVKLLSPFGAYWGIALEYPGGAEGTRAPTQAIFDGTLPSHIKAL